MKERKWNGTKCKRKNVGYFFTEKDHTRVEGGLVKDRNFLRNPSPSREVLISTLSIPREGVKICPSYGKTDRYTIVKCWPNFHETLIELQGVNPYGQQKKYPL